MSLRSRSSIAVTAAALAVTALAAPAVADDGPSAARNDAGHTQSHNARLYKGVVTASSLALRAAPNRGGQIIRWAGKGEVVTIFCKTNGQNILGNRQWYLLTDGTWAWGSARYIKDLGTSPRWC
ncbi:SH3 domain-containing protein [Streptomyces sp. NPDC008196]|uniref:SH3 domain-containing protein n=1 Tax=unclassified Streptomyces TaxID=2593676 RepID=UPI001BAFDCCC|nr:SH3 domain-containing protein [Streptomyces sp. A2-16]QUC56644.1 SH3 domain-containing protein [Streptomyces sp. A2-16]